jgi:hypothetical protein
MPRKPHADWPKCCLHRWAAKTDHKQGVMLCSVCKVHLCLHCFEKFHTIYNLVDEKEHLKYEMGELKEENIKQQKEKSRKRNDSPKRTRIKK